MRNAKWIFVLSICIVSALIHCAKSSIEKKQEEASVINTGNIKNVDEALKYYQERWGDNNSKTKIRLEKIVSNEDLKYLVFFEELEDLYLLNSKNITDDGMKYLKNITNIIHLVISGTNITIVGLSKLKNTKKLKSLGITPNIYDNDLEIIADLFPNLESLGLPDNNIKGPGIQYLKKLKSLHNLNLDGNPITDEMAKYFDGLQDMEIFLERTKVTQKGKAEILRITKNCYVSIKEGDLAPPKE